MLSTPVCPQIAGALVGDIYFKKKKNDIEREGGNITIVVVARWSIGMFIFENLSFFPSLPLFLSSFFCLLFKLLLPAPQQ